MADTLNQSIVLEWNSVLKEALERHHLEATKILLSLARCFLPPNNDRHTDSKLGIDELEDETDDYKHHKSLWKRTNYPDQNQVYYPDMSFFTVLATKTKDVRFMKLFYMNNFKISYPHPVTCECFKCRTDNLGQSHRRIEILRALSNPIWIGMTTQDPFMTSFQITTQCRIYNSRQDAYEKEYKVIAEQNKKFCCSLLDQIENEAEVQCLMKWKHQNFFPFSLVKNLDFIRLAIKKNQKEVVSHTVTQHVITSIVNDGIPGWNTGSIAYRTFLIILIGILYPVTSLFIIFFPGTFLGEFSQKPLVKFINGAASYFTWLGMLAYISNYPKSGLRAGEEPTFLEIVIFVWLFSLLVQEIKELSAMGKSDYFGSGWNWIDINMIFFMFMAYTIWTVIYFTNPGQQDKSFSFVISIGDGCFALALILSYFRLVYLCQITRYLGLLQLCVGAMSQVIFQFAFICVVMLSSFSVGMCFLFHSSERYEQIIHETHKNRTYISRVFSGKYDGLAPTMLTMMWASMSMKSLETLDGMDDGTLIHLLTYLLFTLYYAVSMVVMMNMLIAMMSNSYQQIQNNLEVEHKYARTSLWLQYIDKGNILPCPFNLIPTLNTFKAISKLLARIFNHQSFVERQEEKTIRISTQRCEYKELCKKLVDRYLMKTYKISLKDYDNETSPLFNETPKSECHNRSVGRASEDRFLQHVIKKFKLWSVILGTSGCNINHQHNNNNGGMTMEAEECCEAAVDV